MIVANIIEDGRLAGPQIRIAEVAACLRAYGVETIVLLPRAESALFRERLELRGVRYQALSLHRPARRLWEFARYALSFPWEVYAIYKQLRSKNYDLVHCSGGAWQIKGVIAAKLARRRVLWHLNDTRTPLVIRVVFYLLARLANGFVVAGSRVRGYYATYLPPKRPVWEIQAPVDCVAFDPDCDAPGEPLAGPGLKILSVGNVNPLKGFEYIIRVADMLTRRGVTNADFFIAGPIFGSQEWYAKQLKGEIAQLQLENVRFLGAVADTRSALKSADIYVCTSVAEASPTSVWEAMAMGKPIVSTDVGDVSRFLSGDAGLVVPPRDVGAIADAVGQLAADADLRTRLGSNARRVATERLDLRWCVERHLDVYRRLSGNQSSVSQKTVGQEPGE